jgi:hypothetical protein
VYTYIFMDLVAGKELNEIWDKWDEATRLNIQTEPKDYIRQMRELPGGDYISSLNRGPVIDRILQYYFSNHSTVTGSIFLCLLHSS